MSTAAIEQMLHTLIAESYEQRNIAKMMYYKQLAMKEVATFELFEAFVATPAGHEWLQHHTPAIDAERTERKTRWFEQWK